METKYGYTLMSIDEFEKWLHERSVARTIKYVQQHHTAVPEYQHFNGSNHLERQKAMRDFHVMHNGWSDIAQHFTTFPDGMIATGRSLEITPSGIKGFNTHAICIEHFGNFDEGEDKMTNTHRNTIVRMTAELCRKFNIPINDDNIVYHHWFDLNTGKRTNGTGSTKTCPGTAFFDGNEVSDAVNTFLVAVDSAFQMRKPIAPDIPVIAQVKRYVYVTTEKLNVRQGSGASFPVAKDRDVAMFGSILRVYEEKNGFVKISASMHHWVAAKYTAPVHHAIVNTEKLNSRIGPGIQFKIKGQYKAGEELFIFKKENGFCRVGFEEKWVSEEFLQIKS